MWLPTLHSNCSSIFRCVQSRERKNFLFLLLTLQTILLIELFTYENSPLRVFSTFNHYLFKQSAICRSHECAQFLCELNSVYFDLDACLAEIASSFEPRACILPGNVTANGDYAKPYLSNEYVLNCTKEAQLTQLDQETGALNFTKEGDKENVLCFYSWIKRGEDDSSLVYSKPRRLYRSGLKFTADNYVANITCYEYDRYPFVNIGRVYHETHVWIPNFEHKTAKVGTNVLIVVIESLSHLNFLRLMPKTQAALKNLGHFQFMNGLTKVGDNSFPNSMAMIAGEISDMDYKYKGYWDKRLDYVWNKFNAKGYVTGFMEDFVPIGLFDYRRYGFAHSPTDFFPRPFWYHSFGEEWDLYKSMQNFTWFCFDKKGAKVEVFFNVLMAFIEKMNRHKKPYFMYSFYSQVTHENFNSVKMIDEYTADFLSKVSKYLENTVLIFMGDHGPRFGGYVDTPLGRLEERMPLLAIRIPESLNIEYPHLRKILNLNKDRLMTWFDIHAFLDDIAQEEYHFHPPTNLSSINPTRAIIPANRTCKSALVSEMYCVCNDIVGVEPYYSSHVWRACKKLINQFNVWLPNNCKPLKEKDLLSAEYRLPEKNESFLLIERTKFNMSFTGVNANTTVFTVEAKMIRTAKDERSAWGKWRLNLPKDEISKLKRTVQSKFCIKTNGTSSATNPASELSYSR